MSLSEILLPEFDQEMATTRRMLERVPAEKLDWLPHPKSMPLGRDRINRFRGHGGILCPS